MPLLAQGNTHGLSSRAFPPLRYLLCRPTGPLLSVFEACPPQVLPVVLVASLLLQAGGQHLLLKSKIRLRSRLRFRWARKTRAVTETIHSLPDSFLFYLFLPSLSSFFFSFFALLLPPSLLLIRASLWSAVKTRFPPTTTTSLVQPPTPRAPSQFRNKYSKFETASAGRMHHARTRT